MDFILFYYGWMTQGKKKRSEKQGVEDKPAEKNV